MPDPFAVTDPRCNYSEIHGNYVSGLTKTRYPFTRETKRDVLQTLLAEDTAALKIIDKRCIPVLGRAPTAAECAQHAQKNDLLKIDDRTTLQKIEDASRKAAQEAAQEVGGGEGGNPIRRHLDSKAFDKSPARRAARERLEKLADSQDAAQANLEAKAAAKTEREADPVHKRAVEFITMSIRLSQNDPLKTESEIAVQLDRLNRLESGSLLAADFWKEIAEENNDE